MSNWLLKEEQTFSSAKHLGPTITKISKKQQKVSLLLKKVTVLDNKKLLGASDVILYSIVVNGFPDMKEKTPFWAQQLPFPNVHDGSILPIDEEHGRLLFKGVPIEFLNFYLLVVRDKESTREFAKMLQNNFVAQGIGIGLAALTSIFSGPAAPLTVPAARDATTKAVEVTLDYFSKQKNAAIGTYYVSLIEERGYGKGLHPNDFPKSMVNCGGALEIAYEVLVS